MYEKVSLQRISSAATLSGHERVAAVGAELIKLKCAHAASNARKRETHLLHRDGSDPVQRMLNALQPSSYIRPHRHANPPKSETVILLSGSLAFVTFNEDGTPNEREFVHLHPTKALAVDCRENVWHTFFALEPDTLVFEVKAGPHDAATDKEFAPWAPDEASDDAPRYLSWLRDEFRKYGRRAG